MRRNGERAAKEIFEIIMVKKFRKLMTRLEKNPESMERHITLDSNCRKPRTKRKSLNKTGKRTPIEKQG